MERVPAAARIALQRSGRGRAGRNQSLCNGVLSRSTTGLSRRWHTHRDNADDFRSQFCTAHWCARRHPTMIPYIGIIICWLPAVLIAAFQCGDWTHHIIVPGIFIAIQNLEVIFYAPRIVGNYVGLHPMTVIVSIFVWGLIIGGIIGPLLAVPLTATVKVLLGRYVWGRRLRERIEDSVKSIPVVEEPEVATRS